MNAPKLPDKIWIADMYEPWYPQEIENGIEYTLSSLLPPLLAKARADALEEAVSVRVHVAQSYVNGAEGDAIRAAIRSLITQEKENP